MMNRISHRWAGVVVAVALVVLTGCEEERNEKKREEKTDVKSIVQADFGKTPNGQTAQLFTLVNKKGMRVKLTNYGGIVTSLEVPDRNGKLGDVVLGYENLDGYIKSSPYFGCLVGRYGNRIAKGKFKIAGKEYTLATNNGPNALHGGIKGFDKVLWAANPMETKDGPAVELTYTSKDGEEGYPGSLKVKAVYTLTNDNALQLEYTATTDQETVLNLTHHSYFNLKGAGSGDILGHEMMINAKQFTPVDETLITTGELRSVKGTPMDFTKSTVIGARIDQKDEQLTFGKGYDHNWVVDKKSGELGLAARLYEPSTGRVMEVLSTEPGVQFYAGNFLDGTITGKGGKVYQLRNGLCLEPQHYPDTPNKPTFPSAVLKPGETYRNTIVYKFSAKK
jgi:aldose 1-epimerase